MWPTASPPRGATLGGLGVATVAALLVALLGRTGLARVTNWIVASASAALLANAAGLVAELATDARPYGVMAVAVLLLAAALPDASRRPDSRATEVLSYLVAGFAVVVARPSLITVAVLLAGRVSCITTAVVMQGDDPPLRRLWWVLRPWSLCSRVRYGAARRPW